jgi:glyoxylate/hydroxypyruvate reductase A
LLGLSDYLVCALPLTTETRGIINRETIVQMKRGAFFINVGRGAEVVDADLLQALNDGHLAGASLDVFHQEPLPVDHRYWSHPGVRLTPHIANFWVDGSLPQVVDVWHRLQDGRPLDNLIDPATGY